MSNGSPDQVDDAITTETGLSDALEKLLVSAFENGVDPGGSWVIRNGATIPDWEVQVTELAKRE